MIISVQYRPIIYKKECEPVKLRTSAHAAIYIDVSFLIEGGVGNFIIV